MPSIGNYHTLPDDEQLDDLAIQSSEVNPSMVTKKKILLAATVVGMLSLGASSSFASGPIVLAPVAPAMPNVAASAAVHSTMQSKALSTYRQIREFWLSRAIVR